MGLSAAALVVYIAVTCEGSYGLAQDNAGHFICEPRKEISGGGGGEEEVGDMVANVAKVTVILVVLLTVTFTLSVASWHVMVTRCTGAQIEDQPWSVERDPENPAYIQQVLMMSEEAAS